jgi:hypothetical protein
MIGRPPVRRPPVKKQLSDVEMAGLRDVAHDAVITQPLYKRLVALGLVEQKRGQWKLTHQGEIEMLFRVAR